VPSSSNGAEPVKSSLSGSFIIVILSDKILSPFLSLSGVIPFSKFFPSIPFIIPHAKNSKENGEKITGYFPLFISSFILHFSRRKITSFKILSKLNSGLKFDSPSIIKIIPVSVNPKT